MITCQRCGHVNTLRTQFCHKCGDKLDIAYGDLSGGVTDDLTREQAQRMRRNGLNLLCTAITVLLAMIFYAWLLAPPLPPPALPDIAARPAAQLLDAERWSDTALSTSAGSQLALLAEERSRSPVLFWRRLQAESLLVGMGVNLDALREHQRSILRQQRQDGSFPGGDPLAATALAILALRAVPDDGPYAAASQRGADWLARRTDEITRHQDDLACTLATAALALEGRLSERNLTVLANRLVDGRSPVWQLWALALIPAEQRPAASDALQAALRQDPHGAALVQLLRGDQGPSQVDLSPFSASAVQGLRADQRLAWAWAAWQVILVPDLLVAQLGIWSREASLRPAPPELQRLAGDLASPALAVLALAAPVHVPASAFAP